MAKEWGCIPAFDQAFSADATIVIASLPFVESMTILRMLGEFIITARTAPVALDAIRIGVGLGIVSTDAFAVGGSAMPDPLGEPEYPWLYWSEHWLFFPTSALESGLATTSVRRAFDVKSMRKVKNRESLVFVFQYGNDVGNPEVIFAGSETRVLVAK